MEVRKYNPFVVIKPKPKPRRKPKLSLNLNQSLKLEVYPGWMESYL